MSHSTAHISFWNETPHKWTTFCVLCIFPQLWHQDKAVSFACTISYKAPSRRIVYIFVLAQGKYHLLSLIEAVDLICKPQFYDVQTSEWSRFHWNGLSSRYLHLMFSSCRFLSVHLGVRFLAMVTQSLSIMYAVSFILLFWCYECIPTYLTVLAAFATPLSTSCFSCVDICPNTHRQPLLWTNHTYRKWMQLNLHIRLVMVTTAIFFWNTTDSLQFHVMYKNEAP